MPEIAEILAVLTERSAPAEDLTPEQMKAGFAAAFGRVTDG